MSFEYFTIYTGEGRIRAISHVVRKTKTRLVLENGYRLIRRDDAETNSFGLKVEGFSSGYRTWTAKRTQFDDWERMETQRLNRRLICEFRDMTEERLGRMGLEDRRRLLTVLRGTRWDDAKKAK